MENQKDLKWICLVSLGILFILLYTYAFPIFFAGGYAYPGKDLEDLNTTFTLIYIGLSVLASSTSALFMSGIKRATVYNVAIGSFAVSMVFFFSALVLTLTRGPLVFD